MIKGQKNNSFSCQAIQIHIFWPLSNFNHFFFFFRKKLNHFVALFVGSDCTSVIQYGLHISMFCIYFFLMSSPSAFDPDQRKDKTSFLISYTYKYLIWFPQFRLMSKCCLPLPNIFFFFVIIFIIFIFSPSFIWKDVLTTHSPSVQYIWIEREKQRTVIFYIYFSLFKKLDCTLNGKWTNRPAEIAEEVFEMLPIQMIA